jgi:hypothetical protein
MSVSFCSRTEPRSFCRLRPTTTVNLLRLLELPATLSSAQMENATPPAMESSHTSRKPGVVLKIMVTPVVVLVDDLGSASQHGHRKHDVGTLCGKFMGI